MIITFTAPTIKVFEDWFCLQRITSSFKLWNFTAFWLQPGKSPPPHYTWGGGVRRLLSHWLHGVVIHQFLLWTGFGSCKETPVGNAYGRTFAISHFAVSISSYSLRYSAWSIYRSPVVSDTHFPLFTLYYPGNSPILRMIPVRRKT